MAKRCCWLPDLQRAQTLLVETGQAVRCHDQNRPPVSVGESSRPKAPVQSYMAGHHSCKACVHCVFGVSALPSAPSQLVLDFIVVSPFIAGPLSFVSHINAGLERPPKTLAMRV